MLSARLQLSDKARALLGHMTTRGLPPQIQPTPRHRRVSDAFPGDGRVTKPSRPGSPATANVPDSSPEPSFDLMIFKPPSASGQGWT